MAQTGIPAFWGVNHSGINNGDNGSVNFPVAGDYPFEIDYASWHSSSYLELIAGTQEIINLTSQVSLSGPTQPVWPVFNTAFAPNYPNINDSNFGLYNWINLGPIADATFFPNTGYTLPNTTIIDVNGNNQAPYRAGVTGTNQPIWATGINQLTPDNPNLIWINQGPSSAPPVGTVSTFNGGWKYAIALVNSLDNTVSNISPISPATGNFVGANGVSFLPGSGLNTATIDTQADFVAIFRTTDGQAVPFLIPGTGNLLTATIPLSTYLQDGYVDNTPDTGLNNLIQAPLGNQNTPPPGGAINLTFHLGRIFFSVGNTVYWTAGPDTPVGNGVNGVPPLNFDILPSLVMRIVPLAIGVLVFTVLIFI